jgi:hypothetical protein
LAVVPPPPAQFALTILAVLAFDLLRTRWRMSIGCGIALRRLKGEIGM